ncbi:MAG: YitT family protein [Candidatus Saccharimonadales bacterium]
MILTVISRIEEQKLKDILHRHDPNAFVVISNVHEVMGKNYLPKPHLPAN